MSWTESFKAYLPGYGRESQAPDVLKGGQPQLTAAEVQAHPEYPHVHWDLKPTKQGKVDVAAGRGGPFKLGFELHGNGPSKILWSKRTEA